MTWWEINAAIAYDNEFNADPKKPRELTDAEIARIEADLNQDERMY